MLILEKPYVSPVLVKFAEENNIPVLRNEMSQLLVKQGCRLNLLDDDEFVKEYERRGRLYTMSENALGWIFKHIKDDDLLSKINLLKDKKAFRDICRSIYPDFFYCEKTVEELAAIDASTLVYPLVLKPSVGFLSIGVYVVTNADEYRKAIADIKTSFSVASAQFPDFVVGSTRFLIEEYIHGEEYAVDAYFDENGTPFILNIYDHRFASESDTSDRLYCSSKAIYDEYEQPFMKFLQDINAKVGLKNFPMHIEFRYDGKKAIPIEINPLRFAGFCLNELQVHISGVHPIFSYLNNKSMSKEEMWRGKENDTYSFLVFERPKDSGEKVFDEKKFRADFMDVCECRPLFDTAVSVAATAFIRTDRQHEEEFSRILNLNVKDYMI